MNANNPKSHSPHYPRLGPGDVELMRELLVLFGNVFEEPDTYITKQPSEAYLEKLLGNETFIALAAMEGDTIIGGLAAYELQKFESERSEIYIYDLAVSAHHRRKGVATGLIEDLKTVARGRGAWVIFVQADHVDPPAIALYTKLGTREDVLHFDIDV